MGVFPHEHAQCATWINYRISMYVATIIIADRTIVLAVAANPAGQAMAGPVFIRQKKKKVNNNITN